MIRITKSRKRGLKTALTRFIPSHLALVACMIGCSSSGNFRLPDTIPDDRNPIPKPKQRDINIAGDAFDNQFVDQLDQSFELSRQVRNIFGRRKQAMNVDAYGEVANSSWFTNRNAKKLMSIEEIKKGPNTGTGPDMSGIWTITGAKSEGITPGFQVKDRRGDTYFIKFDPKAYGELASGAEAVSTRLFYAMGYNVPENYIVYFHPRMLKLAEQVKIIDGKGRERLMEISDIEEIFAKVASPLPDGRHRVLASKRLAGEGLGPFRYKGTRRDDPNDIIPHQHHRELRGLRLPSAWLNHFDTKDGNSLDMYVTEDNKSHVEHYLIDFGATLGSASYRPNHPWRGHENSFDPHVIAMNILTVGLYVRAWEKLEGVRFPSIGLYESKLFHPQKYKPQIPNPAFENMTNLDGYWGAKLVMSFTDEQLETAVAQGQYSNPEAAR
ncbi:MAG: hypothetical protein V3U73_05965, partial [bacterium]